MNVGAGAAVLALFVVFCFAEVTSRAKDHTGQTLIWLADCAEVCAPWLFPFALAVPCIVLGLCAFLRVLTRRASTPLPAPADPLATYRDGPPECPRHPFAW